MLSAEKICGTALLTSARRYVPRAQRLSIRLILLAMKGSINNRINILYFLDSLCESSVLAKNSIHPHQLGSGSAPSYYVEYVSRDLRKAVGHVVPEGRTGLPNLLSTRQVRKVTVAQFTHRLNTI